MIHRLKGEASSNNLVKVHVGNPFVHEMLVCKFAATMARINKMGNIHKGAEYVHVRAVGFLSFVLSNTSN